MTIFKIRQQSTKCTNDDIPKFEVKSDSSTLMVAPGSTHPGGYVYKVIGTIKPMVLNEEQSDQLDMFLTNMYNRSIGSKNGKTQYKSGKYGLTKSLKKIVKELTIPDDVPLIVQGTRNITMFYIALEILYHHYNKSKDIDKLREFFHSINQKALVHYRSHCRCSCRRYLFHSFYACICIRRFCPLG